MSLINDALKKAQRERDNPPPAPVPMPGATAMARPGNPAKTPVFKAARWLIGGVIALSLIGTVIGFLIVTLDKPDPQPKAEPPRVVAVQPAGSPGVTTAQEILWNMEQDTIRIVRPAGSGPN